jgi:hypothetical protein
MKQLLFAFLIIFALLSQYMSKETQKTSLLFLNDNCRKEKEECSNDESLKMECCYAESLVCLAGICEHRC